MGRTTVAEQQDSISVPVFPSDTLRMYFQADGMLNEAEIPKVSKALEGAEGVSNLKVQVLEGIGTVELTKQTTVQATGVASNLVELIQGEEFKLQTLNLSFDDEEDILAQMSYLDFEKLVVEVLWLLSFDSFWFSFLLVVYGLG
ncbi:uncharacterized protein LOC120207361 [Hibiscus syriacus]|uniref:uncharacterized protein LOC120207361 n=1 Tax=Hibiscus syriacus TaxID=106335 RepID=UPI001922F169|nr:uncharacterized protein LOC120207361 [Hibiscus syriacus]